MKLFDHRLLADLAAKAATSPRRRTHHTVHASADDLVQRFFVVVDRQSYFRPHRHLSKSELALTIKGRFTLIEFDDSGVVTARHSIGGDVFAYEAPQATWHTLIAQEDGSAFLEVKEGPYDPASAVEFATWAPPEGDVRVPQFMEWLRNAAPGSQWT